MAVEQMVKLYEHDPRPIHAPSPGTPAYQQIQHELVNGWLVHSMTSLEEVHTPLGGGGGTRGVSVLVVYQREKVESGTASRGPLLDADATTQEGKLDQIDRLQPDSQLKLAEIRQRATEAYEQSEPPSSAQD